MNWNEVMNLPLGTKVRLPWWEEDYYLVAHRIDNGDVQFFRGSVCKEWLINSCCEPFPINYYILQDKWELFEDEKQCYHPDFMLKCMICGHEADGQSKLDCQHSETDLFMTPETAPYIFRKVCSKCVAELDLTAEEKKRWARKQHMRGSLALSKLLSGEFSKIILDDEDWIERYSALKMTPKGDVPYSLDANPFETQNNWSFHHQVVNGYLDSDKWYGVK